VPERRDLWLSGCALGISGEREHTETGADASAVAWRRHNFEGCDLPEVGL